MSTNKVAKIVVADETNPAILYLLGLTTTVSRRAQASALANFLRWASQDASLQTFPWGELRQAHVLAYRDHLMETVKPKTTNRYLSAVRGVLKQAWVSGILDADTWARVREVRMVKGTTLPAGRELQDEDLRAMLAAANSQKRRWYRTRDVAILTLLYSSGMRRAEVAGLCLSDLVREGGIVNFRVTGKGHRERLVPVPVRFIEPIDQWLVERGNDDGPLFTARRDTLKPMNPETITHMVLAHSRRAKIADASPHDYRRTFGTRLLDVGADLASVSKLMGHSSISTTVIYDRRGERAKVAAAEKLPPIG